MEEKVLVKSYSSKKTKQFVIGVIIVLLIISLIFLILSMHFSYKDWIRDCYRHRYRCDECDICGYIWEWGDLDWELMVEHIKENHDIPFDAYFGEEGMVFAILHWSFIFIAGFVCLIYVLLSRCNITITEKNINGRTLWGKKVVLPVHMVSAYSTSKIFSVLAITTSSGFIKFPCIGNLEEIVNILQQLLNERQKRTETQEPMILQENNFKNLDELVKLKTLLDNDIITQEEFNEKKKEILGV